MKSCCQTLGQNKMVLRLANRKRTTMDWTRFPMGTSSQPFVPTRIDRKLRSYWHQRWKIHVRSILHWFDHGSRIHWLFVGSRICRSIDWMQGWIDMMDVRTVLLRSTEELPNNLFRFCKGHLPFHHKKRTDHYWCSTSWWTDFSEQYTRIQIL